MFYRCTLFFFFIQKVISEIAERIPLILSHTRCVDALRPCKHCYFALCLDIRRCALTTASFEPDSVTGSVSLCASVYLSVSLVIYVF